MHRCSLDRTGLAPEGVTCLEARFDLRESGAYAIANDTPDGVVWIRGHFVEVDPPRRLVYTWTVDGLEGVDRVTVSFEADRGGTGLTLEHAGESGPGRREQHQAGWMGCLAGLEALFAESG